MDEAVSMPPAALLTADHRALDGLLREVRAALRQGDGGEAGTVLDRIWMRLAVHIRAEHKVLFPSLAETGPDVQTHVQILRDDHDVFMTSLAGALQTLRCPAPDLKSIQVSVEALHHRLSLHNALEESQIYPLADALPPERQRRVLAELTKELAFLPKRYQHPS